MIDPQPFNKAFAARVVAQNGFLKALCRQEEDRPAMTNQDITDAWAKIYGRKEADCLVGAVGSSEPPPDLWRGISGPPGPLNFAVQSGDTAVYDQSGNGHHLLVGPPGPAAALSGVTIVSGDTIHVRSDGVYVNDKNVAPQNMSGFTMLEFGNGVAPLIEWSEPNDPAAWAKPGTPVMQKLIEEIDQWSAVVRDRDTRIATDEREILVLRAERDAWQKMHGDLDSSFKRMQRGIGAGVLQNYRDKVAVLESENSTLKAALDLVREESRKDVDWISAEWREVIAIKDAEIVALKAATADARMIKADETGNHPYHGPTKPVTDADGKVTRQVVPDPTHERFHGSVGDVIAGNVMRPARDQMERALADARVKDGKTPPPFPSAHTASDHRRIGS